VSHRLFRGTLVPFASTCAAAVAVLGILGTAPETFGLSGFSVPAAAMDAIRAQEWWLPGLQVAQAWQATEGAGITVAVLGTGVAAGHPDLAGSVTTGPDYTGSGRAPGSPYWGVEGTAVAAVIAGHGHGASDNSGIVGVAPRARILSVRVTLEFNDPLSADPTVTGRLPGDIAAGIRYAVGHGARIIDLPLDPGTLGLTGQGDPAAAGGSAAERAAVAYALSRNVVLVAPAGDDGQGPGIVNYPAAYPGVIAVGAVGRNGQLASFSSRRPYVSLTAPGAGLVAAAPSGGYATISTTSAASGMVAGTAALLLARFPQLTVAQVTQALTESTAATAAGAGGSADAAGASLPPLPARSADGAGYGPVNAGRALALAALITTPREPTTPTVRPPAPSRRHAAAPGRAASPGSLVGSVVRYVVAGLLALIALLVGLLVLVRSRRARGAPPSAPRARPHGQHEHRRASPAADGGPAAAPRADSPAWPAPGGWQGSSLGEIAPAGSGSGSGSFRPAVAPVPRSTTVPRPARGTGSSSGPPWEPAPAPERVPGPLPMASRSAFPQAPGLGIRVPRDMTASPAARTEPQPALGYPPPGFTPPDFTAPGFTPPGFTAPGFTPPGFTPPGFTPAAEPAGPGLDSGPDFPTRPDLLAGAELPTQQSLDFAAAPVSTDYAPPPAPAGYPAPPAPAGYPAPPAPVGYPAPGVPDTPAVHHEAPVLRDITVPPARPGAAGPGDAARPGDAAGPGDAARPGPGDGAGASPAPAAGASFLWDLAATDVFPVRADAAMPPPAPGAVPPDKAPGASDG
jgi:serine protease